VAASTQGRKLEGPKASAVRVPWTVRAGSQRGWQWEKTVYHQPGMERSRFFLSCSSSYPIVTSSVIRYDPSEEMNRKAREKLRDEAAESAFRVPKRDWRGVSYSHLLPLGARFGNSVGFDGDHEVEDYEVGVVDDPTMKQGKYGIVSRGDDTLGPVVVSILGFAEMRDLKAELNEQWREKNPDQPPSLTLSKIRNLKAEALEMCHRVCGLEVSTVAFACVYLERLIIERIVTKANRRVTMAACLVLAFKFNEPIYLESQIPEKAAEGRFRNPRLSMLMECFESEWQITPDQVLGAEFGVFARLKFRLHCEASDVAHHFQRLLKQAFINQTAREYLGDEVIFWEWQNFSQWQTTRGTSGPPVVDKRSLAALSGGKKKSNLGSSATGAGPQWWRRKLSAAAASSPPAILNPIASPPPDEALPPRADPRQQPPQKPNLKGAGTNAPPPPQRPPPSDLGK